LEKTCVDNMLQPWELNIPIKMSFASKVIMFQECLDFKKSIILRYGKLKIVMLQNKFLRLKFRLL